MSDIKRLKKLLGTIKAEDNPLIVKQKSRDFFWYSPVLKRQLDKVAGDLVVMPKNEAEVVETLRLCHECGVPVTPRGAGTGNYGQAMPLAGGVILNLAAMTRIRNIKPGSYIAEAGTVMRQIDEAAAPGGQEIRFYPSTYATASIGGFIAGGSSGVGSINFGGLRDIGNIIRTRIVTMERSPRVLDLTGYDLQKISHAYGTNGIITEVEMPLTAKYDWTDVLVGYDDWVACARFCDALAMQDGLLTKEIACVAAPAPYDYFLRHRKFIDRQQSIAILMVAQPAMDAFAAFTAREKGTVLYRSDTARADEKDGLPHACELTWNHTTLRALRVDPTMTYLQVLYPFPDAVRQAKKMADIFGDEMIGHMEFVRFNGHITAFGLPLVRFTSEARLDEIIRIHENEGCPVFNPHRYTLEEGGMKRIDKTQLDFKREADPDGLLNPGKMVSWDNPDFDFSSQVYLFPGLER